MLHEQGRNAMLYITRPSGKDIRDDEVELMVRDENGLRVATVVVRVSGTTDNDAIGVNVYTVPGDEHVTVHTLVRPGLS